jgi:hypothetical protein
LVVKRHELEAWVLELVDRALRGQPIEDDRVELKSSVTDTVRAARRLAAHANTAGGAEILWIVGLDERQRRLTNGGREDAAPWVQQVAAQFDGVSPELVDHLTVPVPEGSVAALLFDTRQPPYVVRNPAYGKHAEVVSLEVPWREGTHTRTARRSELLRILSPAQLLPDVEQMSAYLSTRGYGSGKVAEGLEWELLAGGYFTPRDDRSVSMPFHRIEARAKIGRLDVELTKTRLDHRYEYDGPFITSGAFGSMPSHQEAKRRKVDSEMTISGPCLLLLTASAKRGIEDIPEADAEISVWLEVVRAPNPIHLAWNLTQIPPERGYYRSWHSAGT